MTLAYICNNANSFILYEQQHEEYVYIDVEKYTRKHREDGAAAAKLQNEPDNTQLLLQLKKANVASITYFSPSSSIHLERRYLDSLVYLLPFVLQYSPHLWYGLDALTQSGLISPVGSAFMTAFPFLESGLLVGVDGASFK